MNGTDGGGQVVQVGLGQAVITAISDFALADVPAVEDLEKTTFKYVRDKELRRRVAETFFGARWLYKLGLVTLATGTCRAAHVRAQVIDYAAICEAVLVDALTHAVHRRHLAKKMWLLDRRGKTASAWPTTLDKIGVVLRRGRDFRWMIDVAVEEGIVGTGLGPDVHWLRERRNKVHIAEMVAMAEKTYLNTSLKAYNVMMQCTERVGHWMSLHP